MIDKEIQWLLEEKYGGEKSEAFFADCKRLALGEPLAYLIGSIPFLDCTISLDSRPLIPRPETEFWVEKAIEVIRESSKIQDNLFSKSFPDNLDSTTPSLAVLDLCAGSGCIGIAVAHTIKNSLVDFSEIDQTHIPLIQKNLNQNSIAPDRCNVHHTSLFSGLENTYDFILSNPPYIDQTLNRAEESVVTHEPHLALFGGDKGLDIIFQIIKEAPAHLTPGGQLWLEHEPEQTAPIQLSAEKHGFMCTTHPDQYAVERYSVLVLQ